MHSQNFYVKRVLMAFFVSYFTWAVIGLNGWAMVLRQRELYYMYQFFFVTFLVCSFLTYVLIYKERTCKIFPLMGIGLGGGYVASVLAICFWPLLAQNGWEKFLYMRWDLPQLPFSGVIMAGWLNGLIMAVIFWLFSWGNTKQRVLFFLVVFVIAIVRISIDRESIFKELFLLYS